MKKLAILLFTACFLSLTSCKNKEEKESETTANTELEKNQDSQNDKKSTLDDKAVFDINSIKISNYDMGEFPYLNLPENYIFTDPDHLHNGNGKGLSSDIDKEYFLVDGVYLPIEGKSFKGHITLDRNVKNKSFSALELQKSLDEYLLKIGGVKINNGKGYKNGEKERILESDGQAESNGYMNSSQYYENIHTYVIRKAEYNVWIQYNLGGETGYISVIKTNDVKSE